MSKAKWWGVKWQFPMSRRDGNSSLVSEQDGVQDVILIGGIRRFPIVIKRVEGYLKPADISSKRCGSFKLGVRRMTGNLTLSLARKRIKEYTDESDYLMARHAEAMECRDCEELLRMGIEAQKWLTRAEEVMRAADGDGLFEFNDQIRFALDSLYDAWLRPCVFADQWIQSLRGRGYFPENLEQFQEACEAARVIVESRQWRNLATKVRTLNSTEEPW